MDHYDTNGRRISAEEQTPQEMTPKREKGLDQPTLLPAELHMQGFSFYFSDDGNDLVVKSCKTRQGDEVIFEQYKFSQTGSDVVVEELDPSKYVSTTDAASICDVHITTFTRWKDKGFISPVFSITGPGIGRSDSGGVRSGAIAAKFYCVDDVDEIGKNYDNGTGPFYEPPQIDSIVDGKIMISIGEKKPAGLRKGRIGMQARKSGNKAAERKRRKQEKANRKELRREDNPIYRHGGNPLLDPTIPGHRPERISHLMTTQEFAAMFQCSQATVKARQAEGRIPFDAVPNPMRRRSELWRRVDVENWAKEFGLL